MATFRNRALTLATVGMLSATPVTLATDGYIQQAVQEQVVQVKKPDTGASYMERKKRRITIEAPQYEFTTEIRFVALFDNAYAISQPEPLLEAHRSHALFILADNVRVIADNLTEPSPEVLAEFLAPEVREGHPAFTAELSAASVDFVEPDSYIRYRHVAFKFEVDSAYSVDQPEPDVPGELFTHTTDVGVAVTGEAVATWTQPPEYRAVSTIPGKIGISSVYETHQPYEYLAKQSRAEFFFTGVSKVEVEDGTPVLDDVSEVEAILLLFAQVLFMEDDD